MANIGPQPTGAALLDEAVTGAYGEHLTYRHEENGRAVNLISPNGEILATANVHAAHVNVDKALNPLWIPYINAFIAHTNQRVEKYWRTKSYRVIPIDRKVEKATLKGANISAAQALSALVPRQSSDAEQMRFIANLFTRAAECLEREERARRLDEEAELVRP